MKTEGVGWGEFQESKFRPLLAKALTGHKYSFMELGVVFVPMYYILL